MAKTDGLESLVDIDSAVRYWAALGLLMRGKQAVDASRLDLLKLLSDPEPAPRIVAAEAIGRFGSEADVKMALDVLVPLADAEDNGAYIAMMAMNALDYMDDRALSVKDAIEELPGEDPNASRRFSANIRKLIDKALADLK